MNLQRAIATEGWMTVKELRWLDTMASVMQNIIEIGSWKGRSTLALTACKGMVYCIDNWAGEIGNASYKELDSKEPVDIFDQFHANLKTEIGAGKVYPMFEERLTALAILKRHNVLVDMIFIDAGHTYECVKQDIKASLPLLKKDGLLCGHDYADTDPGVIRAVDELYPSRCVYETIWSVRNVNKK